MRRFVAVTAALIIGGSGVATAGTATARTTATPAIGAASPVGAAGPSSLRWGHCSDPDVASEGAVCAMLSVPLDYSHPRGAQIQIGLSMIRHTVAAAKYQGVMLVNPGGPGASGLDLVNLGSFVPGTAAQAYDWIGFAPRGTEGSVPALTCEPDYFQGPRPAYVPTTAALLRTNLDRSAGYSAACGRNGGALLDHLTSLDTVKDMDSIRKALGQSQINFYGYSYGTYLGQLYGTVYPTRVRRMVLDSNVDPRTVWYQANLDQDLAFQANMKIWWAWLAKYDAAYHLGTTEAAVERLFDATQSALQAQPAGGVVGGDEWNDIFLSAGYYQSTWTDLGRTFASWVHGHNLKKLRAEYRDTETPGDDNGFAMYLATQCTDAAWPTSVAKNLADDRRAARTAPFETWNNAWFNFPCVTWPAAPHTPVTIDGRGVASTLLVDETLDAATPFEGSLETRRLFPHSVLLALPGGTSHANSLDGDACEDNLIAAYLATGALPTRRAGNGPDATCQPLPRPVPASLQHPQTLLTAEARNPTAQPATVRGKDRP